MHKTHFYFLFLAGWVVYTILHLPCIHSAQDTHNKQQTTLNPRAAEFHTNKTSQAQHQVILQSKKSREESVYSMSMTNNLMHTDQSLNNQKKILEYMNQNLFKIVDILEKQNQYLTKELEKSQTNNAKLQKENKELKEQNKSFANAHLGFVKLYKMATKNAVNIPFPTTNTNASVPTPPNNLQLASSHNSVSLPSNNQSQLQHQNPS